MGYNWFNLFYIDARWHDFTISAFYQEFVTSMKFQTKVQFNFYSIFVRSSKDICVLNNILVKFSQNTNFRYYLKKICLANVCRLSHSNTSRLGGLGRFLLQHQIIWREVGWFHTSTERRGPDQYIHADFVLKHTITHKIFKIHIRTKIFKYIFILTVFF